MIISGGGTGGHIFPAIAIADALRRLDPDIDILFVGAQGRMEMERVPMAGYPIRGLWISGFQRRLTWKNLLFPVKLVVSAFQSARIFRSFKPDLAIGVGGYASGPMLQTAVQRRITTAIQEQNSFPGATNRILARQVDRIFVAYPGMDRFFPADKIRLTGNPVRTDIERSVLSRDEAIRFFGLDESRRTILVFGGSLGAGVLNRSMEESLDLLAAADDVQVIWQTGKMYEAAYQDARTAQLSNVRKLTFLDRMDMAYAAADVVVCRAGALTISELSLLGKAAILVPSPYVAEDHQTRNARSLADVGAARMIGETDAPAMAIWSALELVRDGEACEQLGTAIRQFAFRDAADRIATELLDMNLKG